MPIKLNEVQSVLSALTPALLQGDLHNASCNQTVIPAKPVLSQLRGPDGRRKSTGCQVGQWL